MDIEFSNGQNGMQAARALRRIDSTVVLIFVTNIAQMAVEGYAVDALDFIVKPIDPLCLSAQDEPGAVPGGAQCLRPDHGEPEGGSAQPAGAT